MQDYPQLQAAIPDYFPQYELPGSVTPWPSYEHREISPSSSYSNFTADVELSDNLNQIGCVSPYPGHSNYMDFCVNEEMQYEGYEQTSSQSYLKLFWTAEIEVYFDSFFSVQATKVGTELRLLGKVADMIVLGIILV